MLNVTKSKEVMWKTLIDEAKEREKVMIWFGEVRIEILQGEELRFFLVEEDEKKEISSTEAKKIFIKNEVLGWAFSS